ncbi:PTS lactose/cellobiose transporter subunit IIA [Vallitalea sp. AN17-2]|uniref:PTS lactose/cellobiose transporter subunit IIA n=1 Tax=Vallitalea maricola TaxID=3074433 RepID=A0ACB5UGM2_9FIRM|nr:PTS lactose/cellobiose transporter subunit IIA [Vallitalea sp. AN17-2]
MNELEISIINIIVNAGETKSYAYEALAKANETKYEEADRLMKKANEALNLAHNAQTEMLHKEASGQKIEISVLFIHAQDHLMTAISEKNLIEQIIELRKVVNTLVKNKGEKSND